MSTRQLIFVGCKILGIFLIIHGLSIIPVVIQTWPTYYLTPLLCGLALFFCTNLIVRMIGPCETADGPPASAQNLAWAGAFGVGVFYLLSWLPSAIVAMGATLLKSFSNRDDSERSYFQNQLSGNVWQWGIGSFLSTILIYVSLRALYGNQPFRWWTAGEESRSDE